MQAQNDAGRAEDSAPTGASPRRRPLTWGKWLVFVGAALCLSLVATAIVGEVIARGFSTIGPRLLHAGRYFPHFSGLIYNEESLRNIYVRTNGDGFRGVDHPIEKPAGILRVAVIGDSFVAAMAVEEDQTFASLIGDYLEQRLGRKVEILNFGIGGSDTCDYLQFYRHFAAKYQPDLVVCTFFNGNDVHDRFPEVADDAPEHPYEKFCQADYSAFRHRLCTYSRFYSWLAHHKIVARDRLREWLHDNAPSIYWMSMSERFERRWEDYKVFLNPPDAKGNRSWEVVEMHLSRLHQEVTAAGAGFLLAGIPTAEQVSDPMWERFCKEGNKRDGDGWSRDFPERRLCEICQRHGIEFVPLLESFRATGSNGELYYGRGHFNVDGQKVAAQTIVNSLVDRKIATSKRSATGR